MPRNPRPPAPDFSRIRIDAQGYDDTGAYWGAGPDVFIATLPDGAEEVTVRARTLREARAKVTAELARAAGAPPVSSAPIGGKSPRISRYRTDWIDPQTGEIITIAIVHARDYLGQGRDHIEVESRAPKGAALPITETGYRSHFITPLELVNAGGPVTFVTAWLDREAKGRAWRQRTLVRAQGDLFQWADTHRQVAQRRTSKRPAPKPRATRAKDRMP